MSETTKQQANSALTFSILQNSHADQYESISIDLSIIIENRYQLITTQIFASIGH